MCRWFTMTTGCEGCPANDHCGEDGGLTWVIAVRWWEGYFDNKERV